MSSFDRLLDRTATIQRKGRVSDGDGGWTEAYADHLIDVKCRRRPAGQVADDQQVADRLQLTAPHVVYFPAGTDVRLHDHVLVDGYTLDVASVDVPSIPVYTRTMCGEVQTGA